jgi:uncharacterized membrane protein YuzA (DUF378 family)
MTTRHVGYIIALILLIIGGLNWGLVGAFNFDLVAYLFGPLSAIARFIYVVVALAAAYVAFATSFLHHDDTATHHHLPGHTR